MIKTKKPKRTLKPVLDIGVTTPLQHKVPQVVKDFKKVKPKEVFGKINRKSKK
jgi:hypothetical protein